MRTDILEPCKKLWFWFSGSRI